MAKQGEEMEGSAVSSISSSIIKQEQEASSLPLVIKGHGHGLCRPDQEVDGRVPLRHLGLPVREVEVGTARHLHPSVPERKAATTVVVLEMDDGVMRHTN